MECAIGVLQQLRPEDSKRESVRYQLLPTVCQLTVMSAFDSGIEQRRNSAAVSGAEAGIQTPVAVPAGIQQCPCMAKCLSLVVAYDVE